MVAGVNEADGKREANIRKLVSMRRYVLHNKRWEKDAVMRVRMTFEVGTGRRFEILEWENAGTLQKHALEKVLESEVEASKGRLDIADSAITAANYNFLPLGMQTWNGRECQVVQLLPKRSSKYLLEGKAWIDPADQAIIRVEGRTSRSVSFWIGKPYIAQDFQKVNEVWVSARNRSVSDIKIFGKTELSVDFTDYQVVRGDAELAHTQKPGKTY
jgi:hypothetical protein